MKTWTSTSGLKAKSNRVSWLWLLLLLNTPALADTPPDLELLEFLGEWQDDSGHWIDPLQLSEASETSRANAAPQAAQPKEQEND